jgi:hypothetical protein
LPADVGHAKRWMYGLLQDNELAEFYRRKRHGPKQLRAACRRGDLIRDTRLRDLLRRSRLAAQELEWRRVRRIERGGCVGAAATASVPSTAMTQS